MAILPSWLYEPLPYVYASVGAAATLSTDSIIGVISGVMLMSAGIYIWYLRFDYRSILRARQERADWLRQQAEQRKRDKQTWLRDEADKIRKKREQDDDF